MVTFDNKSIYEEMYRKLFNAVTDAIAALERCEPIECGHILKDAQSRCEEIFISQDD